MRGDLVVDPGGLETVRFRAFHYSLALVCLVSLARLDNEQLRFASQRGTGIGQEEFEEKDTCGFAYDA